MISQKELSLREVKRASGDLERVMESVSEFKKRIKMCKPCNRGEWYRTRYGMQFRKGELG